MINFLFTDIHFGKHSNSKVYNEDCIRFLNYMKDYIIKNNYENFQIIFLGDWYNERNSVNVSTLNYGTRGLQILDSIGVPVKMLLGNHDLFLKTSRDINSLNYVYKFDNIKLVSDPVMEKDMLFCPWLVGDENLSVLIKKYNPKYVFGHFEIPSFDLVGSSKMYGVYNPEEYKGPKMIFSGHFHTQQFKDNITYVGSCLCQDFSDVGQENIKGFMVLDDVTGETDFVKFEGQPTYRKIRLSELNEDLLNLKNLYLQCVVDQDVENDKLNQLREELMKKYDIRSMIYINELPKDLTNTTEMDITKFDSIEDMVVGYINELDIDESYNKEKLVKMFLEN